MRLPRWLPSVLLLAGLIFLITPWSGRIQWKFEGDGRIFTRTGQAGLELGSFGFQEGYTSGGMPQWDAFMTLGFPVEFLCLGLAAWIVVRDVRTRRSVRGACSDCGYDLRASPERCPECGKSAAIRPAA
jgi:hypothetical protein